MVQLNSKLGSEKLNPLISNPYLIVQVEPSNELMYVIRAELSFSTSSDKIFSGEII